MFDFEKFALVGGSSGSPRLYAYETADGRTTVLGDGYFNDQYGTLQVRDVIIIHNTDEIYTCRVTSVATKSVGVVKASMHEKEYTHYYVPVLTPRSLPDDGITYAPVTGMVAPMSNEFTVVGDTLVYSGTSGRYLFNGSADLLSNKVADVTISLSLSGVVGSLSAVRSFTSANKRGSVSTTGILELANGDVLQVMMKGDGTAGIIASIYSLNLTFLEL